MKTTLSSYCKYLAHTQINYTCTNFADHVEDLSDDSVYRFLKSSHLKPSLVWKRVKTEMAQSANGYIIFDDTVLDKTHSFEIEGVRRQYSGNAHGIIKGIGVVNCVYVNPETNLFWVIDFRIFDPDRDGKTKLDHVDDMLKSIENRKISYRYALMDSWYATADLMKYFIGKGKIFYCPIKANRKVDETGGEQAYQPVENLQWSETDLKSGKTVKLHKFPLDEKVKLFRVAVSSNRTEFIVTNDKDQSDFDAVRLKSAQRWKIEQFHREEKQITGIAKCQCRRNRSQRKHICAAVLVWIGYKKIANRVDKTVYELKHQLLKNYLIAQLIRPTFTGF